MLKKVASGIKKRMKKREKSIDELKREYQRLYWEVKVLKLKRKKRQYSALASLFGLAKSSSSKSSSKKKAKKKKRKKSRL